jgi:hypothetical protein|tara:strand:- start:552 stop:740 length:189 start_codon:yes stop_codon:yes gene_type:complete
MKDLEERLKDDETADMVGKRLIAMLGLRVKTNGRVDTSIGDKTPAGLARTLLRFLDPDQEID